MINEYNAYCLSDFMQIVSDIGRSVGMSPKVPPVLWFRGQRVYTWDLEPSIFRKINNHKEDLKNEENARKEHFIAKNNQFFTQKPEVSSEWLEVMQHHEVKTRLLDWSESAIHSLIFTLECFFDPNDHLDQDRMNAMPCMWVLEPQKWNEYVIQKVIWDNQALDYIERLCIDRDEKIKMKRALGSLRAHLNKLNIFSAPHLSHIFNFAEIERIAVGFSMRGRKLSEQEFEEIVLYLMLYAIFNMKVEVDPEEIPPLAVNIPYHSERIRAQKGVFTVFPLYKETPMMKCMAAFQVHLDAMQNMKHINQCLHRIKLYNPRKIAYEMMNLGMNISWLYPEIPVVSNEIEARKIT